MVESCLFNSPDAVALVDLDALELLVGVVRDAQWGPILAVSSAVEAASAGDRVGTLANRGSCSGSMAPGGMFAVGSYRRTTSTAIGVPAGSRTKP